MHNLKFQQPKPLLDVEVVLKGKMNQIEEESKSEPQEVRYIIPNIQSNFNIQEALYDRTRTQLGDLVREIEVKVPKSPSTSPAEIEARFDLIGE